MSKVVLPFLKKFKKQISDLENVSLEFRPPAYWYSTGNYAVNRILSGDYFRGIPQGRATILAGPSDSGKSFLLSNIYREAQKAGAFILSIDSEGALDPTYLGKLGIDVSEDRFLPVQVVTVSDVIKVISDFIKQYQDTYGKWNFNAPQVVIGVDSLDMLLTDTEDENVNKGVQKGDQGQRAKQLKAFLRGNVVSRIKALPMSFIGTHQVYPADVLEGEGKWKINGAIRYSASQIALTTKLKLKAEDQVTGIRMYVETFKSRFAKLGSKVEVLVPYDKGMAPMSGLTELLKLDGVITEPSKGWMAAEFPGEPVMKFQRSDVDEKLAMKLLTHPALKRMAAQFDELVSTPELDVTEEDDVKVVTA